MRRGPVVRAPRVVGIVVCGLVGCATTRHAIDDDSAVLTAACPESRADALCAALRALESGSGGRAFQSARSAVAREVERDRRAAIHDPALRLFVRDRVVALLVRNAMAEREGSAGDGRTLVRAWLHRFFSAYPPSAFPAGYFERGPSIATHQGTCAQPTELLLIFPGVVRVSGRREFSRQAAALQAVFPCVEIRVVDSGSFVPLESAAETARAALLELDERFPARLPIHLFGYSQGAASALYLLATDAGVARRVRTVVVMNSAAHGSELANLLLQVLGPARRAWLPCTVLAVNWAERACIQFGRTANAAVAPFVAALAQALGVSWEERSPSGALRETLLARVNGLESLTTYAAAQFWAMHGARLPSHVLFVSFRSFVRHSFDLPRSNEFFHAWLETVDRSHPENDMQVRLSRESLGGEAADREVVLPAADGNHWQWAMNPGDIPVGIMPATMARRYPQTAAFLAIYEALHESRLFQ